MTRLLGCCAACLLLLAGCGNPDNAESADQRDATPAPQNIVEKTGTDVQGMVDDQKAALDAAIDAESAGEKPKP